MTLLTHKNPLPDFGKPPVSEVALSVQFNPLPLLRAFQIHDLWITAYRSRFPKVEEHVSLESVIEQFGVAPIPEAQRLSIRFRNIDAPPTARFWFIDEAGNELVQVQQSRFVRNWRKSGDGDQYPRYEHVRSSFVSDFRLFSNHVAAASLGTIVPVQCEVTYVNMISPAKHAEVGHVIQQLTGGFSEPFFPSPEDVTSVWRFVIPRTDGSPVGRLSIELRPAYKRETEEEILQLHLTARGLPLGDGLEGVLAFLDLGREWIVRGFAAITTPAMHKSWERKHDT
jgi:uncharacterized protein (TIGR04255 family)